MVEGITTIYLKELSSIDELFEDDTKFSILFKRVILFLKKIFGIITLNKKGIYILPYDNLDSFSKIKIFFIKKILTKIDAQVIISKKLEQIDKLKQELKLSNIKLVEETKLANYLIPEIIEYICKMTKEEKARLEISLLIENKSAELEKVIIELAKEVKRIQIVTNKIKQFQMLENELEKEYGLACQITNNKRKSLLKSKIIINFDYSEQRLNEFFINSDAIVIDINKKTKINTKLFCGIHIYDYKINSDNTELLTDFFDIKKIYEIEIEDKNYMQIRKRIIADNIRIDNLIGKNGIIDKREYVRNK